jgi:hypothetical protein
MRAAAVNLVPVLRTYTKQIVPPVLATLIAALLIAGFNRAFSGHLVQPRMAALHSNEETRPTEAKTREMPAVEIASASEPTPPDRIFAKDNDREAAKDQPTLKVAVAAPAPVPAAAPAVVTAAPVAAPPLPRVVQRLPEPRVATAPLAPTPVPVVVAAPVQPASPPVAIQQPFPQEPPTVIVGRPMAMPVERPRSQPPMQPPQQQGVQQQAMQQEPMQPAQPRGFDRFVDSMKPSSIFDRMREFGDRIEAAGNEILPSIRQ